MSKHLGDYDASTVVYGKFTTYRPSTGAPYTLGGTPALSVYKDNSTTQSTTGVSLTVDFDSVTGLHHYAIDTSADGTFYSAGSFFDIVITTGTVDSVSAVGTVVGSFTIRKNSALKPATAGRTVVVDASGLVDANTVKVGPTGSGTAQTARDIGASVLLSSGTGTGQLDFTSGVVKANVVQNAGSAITSASGIQEVKVASFAAGAIDAAAIAANAIGASELASDAVAEIADAVWDELLSGHAVSGSYGEAASDWASQQDLTDAAGDVDTILSVVNATYALCNTEIADIKAKTDNLPASPAAVGSAMTLSATGLDLVLVDGVALPKALQRIGAVTAGKLPSGAGTSTEAFVGLDSVTTRVTFTVDASGNRTAVTYNDA